MPNQASKPDTKPSKPTRRDLTEAVLDAKQAATILRSLALGAWSMKDPAEDLPEARIPTVKAWAAWLPECPAKALGEAVAAFATVLEALGEDAGETSLGTAAGIEAIHAAWCQHWGFGARQPHPLKPLVVAWLDRPMPVEPYSRPDSILPRPLEGARALSVLPGPRGLDWQAPEDGEGLRLPSVDDAERLDKAAQAWLPGMGPPQPVEIPPVLPLVAFDLAGGQTMHPGRGAPLPLRIHTEALLASPRSARHWACEMRWAARDFMRWLWPRRRPKAKRLPALQRALVTVDSLRVDVDDSLWRTVSVTALPRSLDAPVVLAVRLPPGSGVGPLVNRPTLRLQGVRSAPAYRAYLGLCSLRNRHATARGRLLPVTVPEVLRDARGLVTDAQGQALVGKDGKPAHWSDPRAVRTGVELPNEALWERLPWLGHRDLVRLCYPPEIGHSKDPGKQYARQYARKSKAALRGMEADGLILIRREFPEAPSGRGRRGRWKIALTDREVE